MRSSCTSSRSFSCCCPIALRADRRGRAPRRESSRHSRSTPCPTMPVAPKRMTFMGPSVRQSIWVETMGSCAPVCHGSSGHQRSSAGGASGSTLWPGRGTTTAHAGLLGRRQHPLDRLGPAVVGEREQPPVHGQHHAPAHHPVGAHRLLGPDVPVRPGAVVLRPPRSSSGRRAPGAAPMSRIAGNSPVSPEKYDAVLGPEQRVAGPQRGVVVDAASAPEAWRAGVQTISRPPHLASAPTSPARRCAPRARPSTPGARPRRAAR